MALCVLPQGAFWQGHRQSITLLHQLHTAEKSQTNVISVFWQGDVDKAARCCTICFFLLPDRSLAPSLDIWIFTGHKTTQETVENWRNDQQTHPIILFFHVYFLFPPIWVDIHKDNAQWRKVEKCTQPGYLEIQRASQQLFFNSTFISFLLSLAPMWVDIHWTRQLENTPQRQAKNAPNLDIWMFSGQEDKQQLFFNSSFLVLSLSLYLLLASHQDLFSEHY